jgi:1,4-alpha-glucan branching enzyme
MNELALIKNDAWLEPYKHVIIRRHERALIAAHELSYGHASLADAANGYLYYGLHRIPTGWIFREWAPDASAIYLLGPFNNWRKADKYALRPTSNGNWELHLPAKTLAHGTLYKLLVEWESGSGLRLPSYTTRAVQDENTKLFAAQVWHPAKPYQWKHPRPAKVQHPLIYEAHIGMSGEEEHVATYNEFRKKVLPRIHRAGYNTLQLMAIQEHPYYGSFGYQVSNFYAASSRFGTPDELRQLIDEAHQDGLTVILDLVHSHAALNEEEGLGRFDGTRTQYFHQAPHPLWNSRCFDYSKHDVLHFLLSNCKFWMEEYRFDGFRFDGVTSMIYLDHGAGRAFTDYSMYFDGAQDTDAIIYLTLANQLAHQLCPNAITIAEDVSGMPGLAAPFEDGGTGFDFRLSMGIADYWIKLLKEQPDEQWNTGQLFHELTNKRADEHTISYTESHDQAMVGDKTIAFRLMDKDMYSCMSSAQSGNITIERGIALHKIIRLLTLATAGDGYLNFMGNEFGHPEWIDFPREGNNWSYKYARRQWHLVDDERLLYRYLADFDRAMIHLARSEDFLSHPPQILVQHEADHVLIFRRGALLFAFNLHPSASFTDYRFEVPLPGRYATLLDSDAAEFHGFARISPDIPHFTLPGDGKHYLQLYLPSRVALVLKNYA